ncbi:HlyD family secretion protein [Desulforamulus aeronauticus]|uniref:HlyD family secretion protein n=1 Tax=Desulforamulus aeronauticus DSM 10349 TaxID=1121421 RepID=A0A1M6QD76_9FIRM|nr:efflux RND transporter periplasmic adaptor subunit [Desulforamulus aeronauticus]SHK18209.1 HlyD family secretion protein [Desulforamulus aeronauticus DSM 10349]
MDKRKKTLLMVSGIMIFVLATIALYYGINNYLYISTEDARVTGDIARINAQITGKLVSCDLEEGMTVHKDQIVARQEAPNQTDTALEQSLLRAPIDGVVIKKQGIMGEIISSGQAVGMVVDPAKLYIVANIEETKLNHIQVGNKVDVSIDQYGGKKWVGKVSLIGEASNSTFSLIPSSSGGTFTKVVQKVPVRIAVDAKDNQIRPGTNAVVRIHIR